jgi:hypothetical protein
MYLMAKFTSPNVTLYCCMKCCYEHIEHGAIYRDNAKRYYCLTARELKNFPCRERVIYAPVEKVKIMCLQANLNRFALRKHGSLEKIEEARENEENKRLQRNKQRRETRRKRKSDKKTHGKESPPKKRRKQENMPCNETVHEKADEQNAKTPTRPQAKKQRLNIQQEQRRCSL